MSSSLLAAARVVGGLRTHRTGTAAVHRPPRAAAPAQRLARPSSASRGAFQIRPSPSLAAPAQRRSISVMSSSSDRYTMADQQARFAKAKEENNQRVLDIDTVYDGSFLKDKRVLITGANRGVGLDLAKECHSKGACVIGTCRKSSDELDALACQVVTGIDVTDVNACKKMAEEIKEPLDIVINNAGYFYEPVEAIDSLNFEEELKMIDICAVGPLRITSVLFNAGLLPEGSKVACITSQGGSVSWRTVQNPDGKDYGHHMSKCAANMAGVLLNQELKHKGVTVTNLHPGFNKTEMTAKYKEMWDIEGAVDPAIGAKRVMYEIGRMTPETGGKFINCEDGLEIPY